MTDVVESLAIQSKVRRSTDGNDGLLHLNPDNVADLLSDLPRAARTVLGLASRVQRGTLDVTLPDGRRLRLGGAKPGPAANAIVRDLGFATRVVKGGDIGIAEAYLQGEWDTPDLTRFLLLFCVNHELIQTMLDDHPVMRLAQIVRHWLNRNTRRQARRNIYAHYDIGNEFYAAWLDPSMTYSSALFQTPSQPLQDAQENKYRSLAEAIELKHGQSVLEIGCGWGGFAEFAARHYDARVTALTISRQQFDYARARIQNAGLADKVDIRFQDYRDETGLFDRVVSIEMIEAVGEKYWPGYFAQLSARLRPGGRAGLQAIAIQDKLFDNYRREVDFIQRYIFPGGMLPAPSILRSLAEKVGMPIIRERVFGEDYARTLATWRANFRAAWPSLTTRGFDERFRRLWEYYFAYCEAGFLSGNIDVRQLVFAKA